MRSLIAMVLVGGAILAGAWAMLSQQTEDREWAELQLGLTEQKYAFAQKLPAFLSVGDERVQLDRASLISWHKDGIKQVLDKYPKYADKLDYIKKIDRLESEGKKDAAQADVSRKRYEWLKDVWDNTISKGSYTPVLTGTNGVVRFDLLSMKPFVPEGGGTPGLKMDMAIWGAAKDQITFQGLEIAILREGEVKPGKTVRIVEQVSTNSPPNIFHPSGPNPDPSEWIQEWPPGLGIGYYTGLPKFPSDAKKYTLRMNIVSRTYSGTTVGGTIEWKNLDVPEEWKGATHAEVKPTTRDADPEDLIAGGFVEAKEE